MDGDVTVVDMKKTRTIEDSWIVSPCGWTPFAGHRCSGWPVMTVVRGDIAMRDDQVQGAPQGKPVEFIDTRRA
jgi:dihydroorotase